MITRDDAPAVKSDMLSCGSNVQEALRALYFYGTDYIVLVAGKKSRLIHKEQLIALLERGAEAHTLENLMTAVLTEPLSAMTQIEDIPPELPLLVFTRKGQGPAGELSKTDFMSYREKKLKENDVALPEWWSVPLPALFVDGERIFMNEKASEVIPCDAKTLARQMDKITRDRVITVRDKKREKTFSLLPLGENAFLIEDISGDFEMAEELVWWAAVGRAFFHRLEENGAVIRRLSPLEDPPDASAEIIPCSWDGELVGSLAIGIPEGPEGEEREEPAGFASDTLAPETPVSEALAPEVKKIEPQRRDAERKTARRKAAPSLPKQEITTPPVTEDEIRDDEAARTAELEKSPGASASFAGLNKNAARKAYGGRPRKEPPKDER